MAVNINTHIVTEALVEAHACSGWADDIDYDDIDGEVASIDIKKFAIEEYTKWLSNSHNVPKPVWLNILATDYLNDNKKRVDWKYVKQQVVDYYQKVLRMEFDNDNEEDSECEDDPINA